MIADSRVTLVHGANGCGKTTMLKTIRSVIRGVPSGKFKVRLADLEHGTILPVPNPVIIDAIEDSRDRQRFYSVHRYIHNEHDYAARKEMFLSKINSRFRITGKTVTIHTVR